MLAKLVYILGIICAIWCVLDILKKPIDLIKKIILIVLVLAFSWVGVVVYYFLLKDKI